MLTTILTALKVVPTWGWMTLIGLGIAYGIFETGRTVERNANEAREAAMVAKADTVMIAYSLELPAPNKPKPIQGTDLPVPQETLDSLDHWNVVMANRIDSYKELIKIYTTPFMIFYSDSVQILIMNIDPLKRTGTPDIKYKPQKLYYPQITQTLEPPTTPWYKTGTGKVIYGIIGAGCIYGAIESEGATRLYLSMAGVTILTIGIAL